MNSLILKLNKSKIAFTFGKVDDKTEKIILEKMGEIIKLVKKDEKHV